MTWKQKKKNKEEKTLKKKAHYNQSLKSIINWIRNCKNGKLNQLRVDNEELNIVKLSTLHLELHLQWK
jgi:hypothetical protein